MQLTGQNNGGIASSAFLLARKCNWLARTCTMNMRNATCVGTQTSKVRVTLLFIPYTVLLAANSQFRIFIGQKMQLTGWENADNMRNATCADTQTSMEWLYCSFPIDGSHLTSWRLYWRYNTKEYVINSTVGSSRRGWLTLSAISREIDCKLRILWFRQSSLQCV